MGYNLDLFFIYRNTNIIINSISSSINSPTLGFIAINNIGNTINTSFNRGLFKTIRGLFRLNNNSTIFLLNFLNIALLTIFK